MIEKITLRVFFVSLFSCATLVLSFFWGGPPAEVFFKIAATFFVVGLAAFLTWFVTFFYTPRHNLSK